MYKIIIWGAGYIYNQFKNVIDFEVMKRNIDILAIVSKDHFADIIDGRTVISKNKIEEYNYDFIVVFTEKFQEVKSEILSLEIQMNKVIDGRVFGIPCFDFLRYASLVKNPVTIISDDCWGGFVYNFLRLRATSPFRNFYILPNDYIKLLKNLDYYLSCPLRLEREGSVYDDCYPLGSLGENEKKIIMSFIHFDSFEKSKYEWDKRKDRVNKNRLFIKMSYPMDIYEECACSNIGDIIDEFKKLNYPDKICFSSENFDNKCVVLPRRYLTSTPGLADSYPLGSHVRQMKILSQEIDILKLLCGEKDFIREK